MLKVGIAVCILIFAAAGVLAYRNSRLISEMKRETYIATPSIYTVYMTGEFTGEDLKTLTPLGYMEYREAGGITKAALCRVLEENGGDLKLQEAGDMLIRHIQKAREKGTFIVYRTFPEALEDEAERNMAERLAEAAEGLAASKA